MINIDIINLIFCAGVVGVAWFLHQKDKNNRIVLFIAVAFGLFGVSYVASLFGLEQRLTTTFFAIRIFGYVFIIAGLLREIKK